MSRTSNASQPPPAPTRRIRLLLVEDELSTVFAVREFFALAGYDVDCAAGLKESAALIERNRYQAVITDLHLSAQRSGEGMLVAEYARRHNPSACIVMLTGYGSETTAEDAHRCGVDMYRTKPVELAQLSAFLGRKIGGDGNYEPANEWEPRWRKH